MLSQQSLLRLRPDLMNKSRNFYHRYYNTPSASWFYPMEVSLFFAITPCGRPKFSA
nr:MAG TPA: hypothetical protein [Caudoviricetes sp.]